MPLYEYCCDECGAKFELLQKVSEHNTTKCVECDNENVKRLVSATSFRLKGSGWYETDFKNNKKPETKSKPTEKPKSKSVEKTKTDSSKD